MSKISVAIIWGTRPEHIKLYPVWLELNNFGVDGENMTTIFTGQHNDLVDHEHLAIPIVTKHNLMKDGQSIQELLGRCLVELNRWDMPFDVILVQGDTTSALAGALAGFYNKIPVAHVEAGLTTWDKFSPYPEEMHRTLIRELATYHFAPTETARLNLEEFGIIEGIYVVGNTVIDTLQYIMFREGLVYPLRGASGQVLVTMHRRENEDKLIEICASINRLANRYEKRFKFKFVTHPRVADTIQYMRDPNVELVPAMDYVSFVKELADSTFVITDSGGIQEEASLLGVPVFVARDSTERMEAIDAGVSRLIGTTEEGIFKGVTAGVNDGFIQQRESLSIYGDGMAGKRIAKILIRELGS